MKNYEVYYSQSQYGYVKVKAKSEKEAEEKVKEGNWELENFVVKDGEYLTHGIRK